VAFSTNIYVEIVILLLFMSAWRDICIRVIDTEIVFTIAIIGTMGRLNAGLIPLCISILTAGLLFVILLALAMRGWLGGGDVKLAAALAVGLPPAATWDFITATVLAGGLLGLGYLAGPHFAPRPRPAGTARPLARILAIETWRLRRGGPLPYGVAIAAGGIFVLLTTPG
jgi:prepilin peptidase CpaA